MKFKDHKKIKKKEVTGILTILWNKFLGFVFTKIKSFANEKII